MSNSFMLHFSPSKVLLRQLNKDLLAVVRDAMFRREANELDS